MDTKTFLAQVEAWRRRDHAFDGITFKLLLPKPVDAVCLMEDHRDVHGNLQAHAAFFRMVSDALIGWEGATTRHIAPDAEAAPLAYSPEARALLLKERTDILDDIRDYITEALAAQHEAYRAARLQRAA